MARAMAIDRFSFGGSQVSSRIKAAAASKASSLETE
jgi:hypothetical protein